MAAANNKNSSGGLSWNSKFIPQLNNKVMRIELMKASIVMWGVDNLFIGLYWVDSSSICDSIVTKEYLIRGSKIKAFPWA